MQEKPIEQRVRLSEEDSQFLEEIRERQSLRNASAALRYCIEQSTKVRAQKKSSAPDGQSAAVAPTTVPVEVRQCVDLREGGSLAGNLTEPYKDPPDEKNKRSQSSWRGCLPKTRLPLKRCLDEPAKSRCRPSMRSIRILQTTRSALVRRSAAG